MRNTHLLDYLNGNIKLKDLAKSYGTAPSNAYSKIVRDLIVIWKEDQETIDSLADALDDMQRGYDSRFDHVPQAFRWLLKLVY